MRSRETARRWLDGLWRTVGINDQHLMIEPPATDPTRVGDAMALGISHPCTTLDKWRALSVLNDDDNVIEIALTCFWLNEPTGRWLPPRGQILRVDRASDGQRRG